MFTAQEIDRFRFDTPGVVSNIHLNNAGAALMPKVVIKTMQQHLLLEANIGGYEAAAARKSEVADFYAVVSQLIGALPRQIAYAASATDAYSRALSAIPFSEGDIILTTTNDYVSNQLAFLQLKARYGVRIIKAADKPSGTVDCESIQKLIKRFQPKVVAVTHVPTNSGLVQPIQAIGEICEKEDLIYLVDACQSAGQLPLDVRSIKCDFLSATFRKYLRGSRGSGFLYVSDRILEKDYEPLFIDLRSSIWRSEEAYELLEDAKRFELWEKSYVAMLGSWAATRYLLDVGIEKIEKRVKSLSDTLRSRLSGIKKIRTLDSGNELCGIVTFTVDDWDAVAFKSKLDDHGINASLVFRESALMDMDAKGAAWACRFSPHYYNIEDEIEETLAVVESIVS